MRQEWQYYHNTVRVAATHRDSKGFSDLKFVLETKSSDHPGFEVWIQSGYGGNRKVEKIAARTGKSWATCIKEQWGENSRLEIIAIAQPYSTVTPTQAERIVIFRPIKADGGSFGSLITALNGRYPPIERDPYLRD